jgi:hypothetical protein
LLLLKQITEALKKAGWAAVAWNGPGLTVGDKNSDHAIGLASVAGIAIFVNPDSKTELWGAVAASTTLVSLPTTVGWPYLETRMPTPSM